MNLLDVCRLRRLKIAANTTQKTEVGNFTDGRKTQKIITLSNIPLTEGLGAQPDERTELLEFIADQFCTTV